MVDTNVKMYLKWESGMSKYLAQALKIVIVFFVAIFPVFFLTNLASYFDFPKVVLIATTVGICLALWAAKAAFDGKLTLNVSSSDLPLFLLVLAFIVSAILKTPNKMEAFALPGVVTVVTGGFLIYFISKTVFKDDKTLFANALFASGLLVSLISIFAFANIFASIPQLPALLKDPNFSPIGGKLPEALYLLMIIPVGISLAMSESDKARKIFYFLATGILAISLLISASLMLPGKPGTPVVVDFQTGWSVAIDTLKISPIFGIGPSNYLTAFTRFLPLTYNSSPFWANRFFSAGSYLLTLVTETGILGFVAFAATVFMLLKKPLSNIKHTFSNKAHVGYFVSLLLIIASFILLPASLVLITTFFLLCVLNSHDNEVTMNLSATSTKNGNMFVTKFPSVLFATAIMVLVALLFMIEANVVMGERHYKKAVDAILGNNAKVAYDELRAAINKNSKVDRYHATLDQLDLALARGLSQKKDLTEQDRNTVAQLVQQAIAEAKATVSLNPLRSANWELLARTYQSIIPFAKGADEFTVVSFSQAIALDPINPNLRIALGGVYYALGKYDDAINAFVMAVTAKPDLANAHYNLALAYREKKDYDKAIAEMNKVLSLVQKDSPDYNVAKNALDELEKNKPVTGAGTDNLTPPEPVGTSNIKPPITLPEDSTPPTTGP